MKREWKLIQPGPATDPGIAQSFDPGFSQADRPSQTPPPMPTPNPIPGAVAGPSGHHSTLSMGVDLALGTSPLTRPLPSTPHGSPFSRYRTTQQQQDPYQGASGSGGHIQSPGMLGKRGHPDEGIPAQGDVTPGRGISTAIQGIEAGAALSALEPAGSAEGVAQELLALAGVPSRGGAAEGGPQPRKRARTEAHAGGSPPSSFPPRSPAAPAVPAVTVRLPDLRQGLFGGSPPALPAVQPAVVAPGVQREQQHAAVRFQLGAHSMDTVRCALAIVAHLKASAPPFLPLFCITPFAKLYICTCR